MKTKGEQASDIAVVQLDAGSQSPRQKRKYMAVDQRLKLLKEAYIGGEKTKWELTKWEDTGDTSPL